ncbi:MAG TPA: DinB family protein [Vicinamibacterales bacterium]|nr:DinB family protein [Vicinamibacterales bacterium]
MGSAFNRDAAALGPQLEAIESDARKLVSGLTFEQGAWRSAPESWSVAECLDHLATANRVYLEAMRPAAEQALAGGKKRKGPAFPGLIGGWFVSSLEPPAKTWLKGKAPRIIRPRSQPPLNDAAAAFFASHRDVGVFLERFRDIDLARTHFPNPFIQGVRFSLATGLNVIAAHERRHLWQAWNVRRAEAATGAR